MPVQRINKMLIAARCDMERKEQRREAEELQNAIEKMTTEQLYELVDGNPSEERVREIFASVGELNLLESG